MELAYSRWISGRISIGGHLPTKPVPHVTEWRWEDVGTAGQTVILA